jgi:hypothetical protein
MIEPEIAFADLSDNAALAEGLRQYAFAALLIELASCDHLVRIPMLTGRSRIFPALSNVLSRL